MSLGIVNFTYSSIDSDNRIKKEICAQLKLFNFVMLFDLNSKMRVEGIKQITCCFIPKRIFGIPGLSSLKLFIVYFLQIWKHRSVLKTTSVAHCNDVATLPFGVLTKLFINRNIKIVYDAHEYESETNGINRIRKITVRVLENILIRFVEEVIVVSASIGKEYKRLYALNKMPILVMNTSPFCKVQKKDIFRKKFNISIKQKIFLYQGGLCAGRGVDIILQTFAEKKESAVVFMGDGSLKQKVKEYAEKYCNIFYHPSVLKEELLDHTSSADVGLCLTENTCLNHYYCLPNKFFEYIMAEIPIIVFNLYELRKIILKYQIGYVVQNDSKIGLKTLLDEIDDMKNNQFVENIKMAKKKFTWENDEGKLLDMYTKML